MKQHVSLLGPLVTDVFERRQRPEEAMKNKVNWTTADFGYDDLSNLV